MKSWKLLPLLLTLTALVSGTIGLTGCAALEAPNTESLLTAAGFHTKTPGTPKQRAFYNGLSTFELQRNVVKGQVVYTYADKTNKVIYFGDEKAYQRYKQLGLKQQIAEDELSAAEMNEDASLDWNGWGPWGTFWD
jgi:hypothetical protein